MQKSSRFINNNQKIEVIKLYNDKKSLYSISRITKISRPTVRKILKEAGIRDEKPKNNQKFINISLFKNINNEASAYFLGLMFADGNNYRNNKKYDVSILLKKSDVKLLNNFKKLICPKHTLYEYKNAYKILFRSKIVSDQLYNLGCVDNKSLKIKFPELNNNILHHFIRGYFDGDGCINKYLNKSYYKYSFSLVSTIDFCLKLKEIFKSIDVNCYLNKNKYKNKITTELIIGGNKQVYRLFKWLYKDSKFYLERKYLKFIELENQIKKAS